MSSTGQHSFYGWEFDATPYWCLLQFPGPWLLIVEDRSPLLQKLIKRRDATEAFERFLHLLRTGLEEEERFSKLQWYTRDEYQGRRT